MATQDPAARAAWIRGLRYRDLKDPTVLADVLAACRDSTPVPGEAPRSDGDPFGSFFGEAGARSPDATVGDVAAERLESTGLPPDPRSAEVLAQALAPEGHVGSLARVAAEALGLTRWEDLDAALRVVVPALLAHDQPLFQTIARLPEDGWAVLAEVAAAPLAPRLWQELLNHAPAHPLAVEAVVASVTEGRLVPDEGEAATLLGVLASWNEEAATHAIASVLEATFPWASAWPALVDTDAAGRFGAWLALGEAGPDGLVDRLAEILRHRGRSEESEEPFPLAAWLSWAGRDPGVVAIWGASDPQVRSVLQAWAVDDSDVERAWSAAASLAEGGLEEAVRSALADRVESLPWKAPILDALANADPALPWLAGALAQGVGMHPEQIGVAVPALIELGPDACRAALRSGLDRAQEAPEITTPQGRGTVRIERDGVDVDALRPLLEPAADSGLAERLEELAPLVRGE